MDETAAKAYIKSKKWEKYAQMKEEDTENYLRRVIVNRIYQLANEHIEEIIGGTLSQLKTHIESQFVNGQTWKNHGTEWHIDHIIPIKYSENEKNKPNFAEMLKRLNYKNHQPMHPKENISKGNRYIGAYTKIAKTGNVVSQRYRRNIITMDITDIEKTNRMDLTYIAAVDNSFNNEPKTINNIISAPELTAEDIGGLTQGISPKDRAAVAKYYLRRCYNYNGVITPAIARTYGDKSLKMQYHARKNLREVHDEVFACPDDAAKILGDRFRDVSIEYFANANGNEIDDLRKLFDFNRDSICVKLLSILGLRLGDTKILSRDEIIRALDPKSAGGIWLSANCKLICTTFGTKVARLPGADDPNFLRSMLDFINGKLKSRYGISIKLTAYKSDQYHIDDPFAKLFTDTMEIPDK